MEEDAVQRITAAGYPAGEPLYKTPKSVQKCIELLQIASDRAGNRYSKGYLFSDVGYNTTSERDRNVLVSMPDYKTGRLDDAGKDIYQDIAYPVTRQFRQELYDEIVKEYLAIIKN